MGDDAIGLPIKLGPCSNGKYVPPPPSSLTLEAARRAREACAENARRTGMSRRDFLLSLCGAATTLTVLAACSKEESAGKDVGDTFTIPPDATTDTTAAREAIGGDGFVMDVQTHFLEYDDAGIPPNFWGDTFPQSSCGEANNGAPETSIDGMAAAVERWPITAWKVCMHSSGPGWYLGGREGSDLGPRFIREGVALGVPIIAVHKGFSGGSLFASPVDVGPAARDNPEVTFTIYHSGYESGGADGPFEDATRDAGINRLIASLPTADGGATFLLHLPT